MKIKFELTIDAQPDNVAFDLKWPERGALSGVSFMGSGTNDPLDSVVTSVAAQIKTIIEDRFLQSLPRRIGRQVRPTCRPAWTTSFERKWDENAWEYDAIQFPRLLAEIRAAGLTPAQIVDISQSMDITDAQLEELLERAERAFEAIKGEVAGGESR